MTPGGIPMFNVALPIMAHIAPDTRFALLEV
jgi:hypothetical protein